MHDVHNEVVETGHGRGEDAGVAVVAVTDVGDHSVERYWGVADDVDGDTGEVSGESHCAEKHQCELFRIFLFCVLYIQATCRDLLDNSTCCHTEIGV